MTTQPRTFDRFPAATNQRRQYQPDFLPPDYDICIEYCGVDEHGQPAEGRTGDSIEME